MRKNIIFDLDLTLVDTTVAEPYRSKRDWNGAYSVLPQCSVYEGLQDIFDAIRESYQTDFDDTIIKEREEENNENTNTNANLNNNNTNNAN